MVAAGFVIALLAAVSSVFSQSAGVMTSCTVSNTAALTFDDGPYIYLQQIVDTLDNAGVTGTFFFNGNNWACIYSENSAAGVLYAIQHGHQISSHTWSHVDLTTITFDQIHNQMWLVEQALQKIAGVSPAFMRPPYGSINGQVQQVAQQRNQTIVTWDFDSGDSTGSTPEQSEAAYDALVAQKPNTILALNHETYQTTAQQVLPHAIQKLQAAGYRLVSVAECLGLSPYQSQTTPGSRDSTWTCDGTPAPGAAA